MNLMPFCPNCGSELPKDARFCPSCGRPVSSTIGQPLRERRTFRVTGKPKLTLFQRAPGRINVEPGAEGQVIVDVDLREPEDVDWSATQEGQAVIVKARALVHPFRWPRYFYSGGPKVDITVTVPKQTDLDLSTSIAQTTVKGLSGFMSLECSVTKISVEKCEGNIKIRGRTGQIDVRDFEGEISVDSTTGPVTMENVTGTVFARNTTGPIKFNGILSGSENRFRTSTGPIEITLQRQSDLAVDAYSRIGTVTCVPELTDARYERGQYIGHIGSGVRKLLIETTTGPITIRH